MSEKSFGESGRLPDSEDFHKVGEMTMDARHEVTAYTSRRRRKKRWRSAVMALAAVVVFCTTYALILPAITMAQQTYCGMEEPRHGADCYETVLLCDKEFDVVQPEGHIHTATCCDYEEVLTCGLEECEDTLHEHTDDCYDEEGNLVCTQPEVIEGHTHTEDCYGYEETLICGEEEQQEISEPHRHTEACYTREFVCTKPEHTHSLICYSDKSADLESAGEWEATIPELTGETAGENVALVAKSQIGYTQSGRNYEVDDAGGKHGYALRRMVRLSLQRVVRDVRLVLPALRGRGAGGCSVCRGLRLLDRTADRRWALPRRGRLYAEDGRSGVF